MPHGLNTSMQSIACHLGMHATTTMLVSVGQAGDMHAAHGPICGDHKTLDKPAGGMHATQKYSRVHAFRQACKHMHPLALPCAQARMLASQGSDSCRGPYHRRHACTKEASCPIFIRVMRSHCHARVAGAICWRGWRPPGASAGKALPLRGSALRHVGRLAALAVASGGLAVGGASQSARAPCRRLHVHIVPDRAPAAPQTILLLCLKMWHAAREAVHIAAWQHAGYSAI